jgi:hypothetical protein
LIKLKKKCALLRERDNATQILTNLGILQEIRSQGVLSAWVIKSTFKKNLYLGIFSGETTEKAAVEDGNTQSEQAFDPKIIEKLDTYSLERWESILKYIVNPKDSKNQICNSTKDVLKFAGLMKSIREDGTFSSSKEFSANPDDMTSDDNVILTSNAFQFLLWNRRLQIWFLIIKLLEFSYEVVIYFFHFYFMLNIEFFFI